MRSAKGKIDNILFHRLYLLIVALSSRNQRIKGQEDYSNRTIQRDLWIIPFEYIQL